MERIDEKKLDVTMAAGLIARPQVSLGKVLENHYLVECFDKDGNLKWVDEFDNIVVDVGLNDSLDKHLKGSGYTAGWFIGLTSAAPTVNAADTMASHAGWTEVQTYSEGVRQTLTLGAVSGKSVDNTASKGVFSINGTVTVGGCFVTTVNTKGGTTGTLYGAGAFTGSDRAVVSGDTLNVTVTCTAA